jgi:predicted lipid-binding transport protein (Tim44 family)
VDFLKAFFGVIGVVIVVSALAVAGREYSLRMEAHYAPREEQVRHNTFECSQSHSDGMAREIRQYQDQYGTADAAGKTILRQRILQDAESQNSDACPLPSDVQLFVQSIK